MAFLFGAFASLAWMALLSFAIPVVWISPAIPWTLVIATISVSGWLMHRLQNIGDCAGAMATRNRHRSAFPAHDWINRGSGRASSWLEANEEREGLSPIELRFAKVRGNLPNLRQSRIRLRDSTGATQSLGVEQDIGIGGIDSHSVKELGDRRIGLPLARARRRPVPMSAPPSSGFRRRAFS